MLGVKRNQMKDTHIVANLHCGTFPLPIILVSNLHITVKLHTIYTTQKIENKVITVFRAGRHLETSLFLNSFNKKGKLELER